MESNYRPRRSGLSSEAKRERTLERSRRNSEARRRAWMILSDRHREEYRELLAHELAVLEQERGPLPGDAP